MRSTAIDAMTLPSGAGSQRDTKKARNTSPALSGSTSLVNNPA